MRFRGKHLFVNVDAEGGELTAEVLDEPAEPIAGLAGADCVARAADKTQAAVTWKDGDLAAAAGKPVRFRFHLKNGRLFAFWVSPEETGASHGYVAAGGPGLTDRDGVIAVSRDAPAESSGRRRRELDCAPRLQRDALRWRVAANGNQSAGTSASAVDRANTAFQHEREHGAGHAGDAQHR